MTDDDDKLVIARVGSTQRWVVHLPVDYHGDGHVHSMSVEISDDGVVATGSATFEGQEENLCDFLNGLARDWRGWPDTRSWTSLEGELTLDASHDGLGHVLLAITLRRPKGTHLPDSWSARVVLTLEAGEELSRLVAAADHFLRP